MSRKLLRYIREGLPLTARQQEVAALCDGKLSLQEIAQRLGITVHAANNRRLYAESKLGHELVTRDARRAVDQDDSEETVDSRMNVSTGCDRCGLTGRHVCIGGIEEYAYSGTSGLGEAGATRRRSW